MLDNHRQTITVAPKVVQNIFRGAFACEDREELDKAGGRLPTDWKNPAELARFYEAAFGVFPPRPLHYSPPRSTLTSRKTGIALDTGFDGLRYTVNSLTAELLAHPRVGKRHLVKFQQAILHWVSASEKRIARAAKAARNDESDTIPEIIVTPPKPVEAPSPTPAMTDPRVSVRPVPNSDASAPTSSISSSASSSSFSASTTRSDFDQEMPALEPISDSSPDSGRLLTLSQRLQRWRLSYPLTNSGNPEFIPIPNSTTEGFRQTPDTQNQYVLCAIGQDGTTFTGIEDGEISEQPPAYTGSPRYSPPAEYVH